MIGRLLCLIGLHDYDETSSVAWAIGDGHPSRWRDSGVRDVTYGCQRAGCQACIVRREYRSKSALRRFNRSRPPR